MWLEVVGLVVSGAVAVCVGLVVGLLLVTVLTD